jgi:hypothetical protein
MNAELRAALLDELSDEWTSVERAIWPNGPAHGTGSGAYAALKAKIIDSLASPAPLGVPSETDPRQALAEALQDALPSRDGEMFVSQLASLERGLTKRGFGVAPLGVPASSPEVEGLATVLQVDPDRLTAALRIVDARAALTASDPVGLDVDRLARALDFANPGQWPASLRTDEFARVVARAYVADDVAVALPCTFQGCGRLEGDPVHPGPDEPKGIGRHVYRHDAAAYLAANEGADK